MSHALQRYYTKNFEANFLPAIEIYVSLQRCNDNQWIHARYQFFLKYYECGITSYLITLDGWRHDNTRPHYLEINFKTIIDNVIAISHLPKEKYQFTITLRRNLFPEDYDFTWYDYLSKLFGKDDRISVAVFPVRNWAAIQ